MEVLELVEAGRAEDACKLFDKLTPQDVVEVLMRLRCKPRGFMKSAVVSALRFVVAFLTPYLSLLASPSHSLRICLKSPNAFSKVVDYYSKFSSKLITHQYLFFER